MLYRFAGMPLPSQVALKPIISTTIYAEKVKPVLWRTVASSNLVRAYGVLRPTCTKIMIHVLDLCFQFFPVHPMPTHHDFRFHAGPYLASSKHALLFDHEQVIKIVPTQQLAPCPVQSLISVASNSGPIPPKIMSQNGLVLQAPSVHVWFLPQKDGARKGVHSPNKTLVHRNMAQTKTKGLGKTEGFLDPMLICWGWLLLASFHPPTHPPTHT